MVLETDWQLIALVWLVLAPVASLRSMCMDYPRLLVDVPCLGKLAKPVPIVITRGGETLLALQSRFG